MSERYETADAATVDIGAQRADEIDEILTGDALVVGDPYATAFVLRGTVAEMVRLLGRFCDAVAELAAERMQHSVERFAEAWSHGDMAEELATRLSCIEVETLVALLDTDGRDAWLRYHLADCEEHPVNES